MVYYESKYNSHSKMCKVRKFCEAEIKPYDDLLYIIKKCMEYESDPEIWENKKLLEALIRKAEKVLDIMPIDLIKAGVLG